MEHLLTIEQCSGDELRALVERGAEMKAGRMDRSHRLHQPLKDQAWGIVFSKSSTRTRVSFEVGIRELGGWALFLSSRELQLGRGEPIQDTSRVMGRMLHGAVIRTFAQKDIVDFAEFSGIPTINALTDEEHPCQILADLLTMKEKIGGWEGKKVVFLGDGDCNMTKSWMWAAERLGFELVVAAPKEFQVGEEYLAKFSSGNVRMEEDAMAAVAGADVLYTDVWVSMGKEEESAERIVAMQPYQVNEALVGEAKAGALVMHCLPAYRENEITASVLEAHADTIFQQAENRLHAQKAVLEAVARSAT